MNEEKQQMDGEVNPHGLADHKALRKMGTERLKELLDQTYEMRKDRLKSRPSASPSVNNYIDEWITVVEEELHRRETEEGQGGAPGADLRAAAENHP